MVTFATATKNSPSFPTRAPAQRRVSHSVANTCLVPNDSHDLFKADCETLAQLVSPSRDPMEYLRTAVNLYMAYFATKAAVDPAGNDWVWPWQPNAQWWWPFNSTTPPTSNPFAPPASSGGVTVPPWAMTPIYACAAGALAGVTADQVERIMNGESINLIDGQAVAAAVTSCFWAGCGAVVISAAIAAPTIVGTCVILGAGGLACLYAGKGVCEGIAAITGAKRPWFCDALPWPSNGGGGGGGGVIFV